MKLNFKKLALIPAAIVLLSVPVVAKQAVETAEITFKNITVYVDGQILDTTAAEPFIYNGTTYLPLRTVAEAIGKEVNWSGETNTVYLGAMPSVYEEQDTLLEDMYSYNNTYSKIQYTKKGADNKNNSYSTGAIFTCVGKKEDDVNSVEYSLNGNFSVFSGVMAVPYVERNVSKSRIVKFYGDGELLYTSSEFTKDSDPEPFKINVSNVSVLQIKTEGTGSIGLYDAQFYVK